MRVAFLSGLVVFTATTTAILVTYPPKGANIDWSKPVTIKWDSVQTDPSTFDLYLVNQAVNPSVSTLVAADVDTSKGSYTIKANDKDLTNSDSGGGYQIDLKSSSGDGILAQSQQFKVTDAKAESASASSSGVDYCQYFLDFTHFYFYLFFIFYDEFFYQCVYSQFLFLVFFYPFYYSNVLIHYFYFCFEFYLNYVYIIKDYTFKYYTLYSYKDSFIYFFSSHVNFEVYFYLFLNSHIPFHYEDPYYHTFLHCLYKHQYTWSVYGAMS
ncbi:hypothetical protein PMG11_05331 [Penicillium brasilianum]|uniref:Yeast cell wall synthesis Kre9/Knh1-like N-terminal domain-containing protein n=1 Tax=Penicillium brasilianum TaxID=104259 RepID=A0A0F7VK51_PENBI|nr:hypothetical protein PMG11_05331 [Penicillium brasilianum]